ncbi:MAG: hypothetical protein AAF668_17150 [Pseudomonadota bacterium]
MKYDFDIFSVTPSDLRTKYTHLLSRFCLTDQSVQSLAMFRDPQASKALSGASPAIRDCFTNSGFALNCFDDGCADQRFASGDKDGRAKVLAKLQEGVEALPMDVNWNGFDIGDFFVSAYGALPTQRTRKTFRGAARAFHPPMTLLPSARVVSRVLSTVTSRI